jgi:hypothetical protein
MAPSDNISIFTHCFRDFPSYTAHIGPIFVNSGIDADEYAAKIPYCGIDPAAQLGDLSCASLICY